MIDCDYHKVSNVGYSINNMKFRFSNTKCQFKKKRETCEIVKHLLDKEHDQVDISSIKTYDKTLCKYITLCKYVTLCK